MKKVYYLNILLIIIVLFSNSVKAQIQGIDGSSAYDWRDDPYEKEKLKIEKFNRAVSDINMSSWGYTDYFEEEYSSFIEEGSYYSNKTGLGGASTYLVLNFQGNQYIFKNVPYKVWKGLKEASSKGEFYNIYIRGRYSL
ncbi:KTSC domain-containing protein [Lutibacter oricola]|uniref:KTSC domain-containing protein n=1 Tax=Lutibacter oricola TaxID=762486 RepID=A0A1H3CLE2_9FLAO|nr:KTSC domain-containing protein [Lutibacter oricola]SDX54981.1 KTSC domain-containing protein [Lutibacter oricola]